MQSWDSFVQRHKEAPAGVRCCLLAWSRLKACKLASLLCLSLATILRPPRVGNPPCGTACLSSYTRDKPGRPQGREMANTRNKTDTCPAWAHTCSRRHSSAEEHQYAENEPRPAALPLHAAAAASGTACKAPTPRYPLSAQSAHPALPWRPKLTQNRVGPGI